LETRVRRYRPAVLEQDYRRKKQHFEDVVQRLGKVGKHNLDGARRKLDALGRLNETLSYKATLVRGFAVVRADGAVVTDSRTAKAASALEIQFADGRVKVGGKTISKKSVGKPPEQGSLF